MRHEQAVDTKLAEQYTELAKIERQMAWQISTFRSVAGDKGHYVGRSGRKEYDMTPVEAEAEAKRRLDADEIPRSWSRRQVEDAFERMTALRSEMENTLDEIAKLGTLYTGWSRFFLVTSSAGHIHSSMSCSTCYPRTTYGWLPELSGLSEKEAVEAHGPALCSVCFPDAPVEMVGGKITKAKAEKAAANKQPAT